jgi:uncharacterized membrane-anchored protein
MNNMMFGNDIVNLLEGEGLTLNYQLKNTIQQIVYEACENAKNEGIQEGKKLGINNALSQIEYKISVMRSENIIKE